VLLAFRRHGVSFQIVVKLSVLLLACWLPLMTLAERINQEGRILGPMPVVTSPLLFNSSNADAVVSAMQIFPVTNPWNECVSNQPVLVNSDAMLAQMIFDFTNGLVGSSSIASHLKLHINFEMNYVLVPDNQTHVPVYFFNYPDDSDFDGGTNPVGLYPIPTNQPIEEWPLGLTMNGTPQTLQQWQTNENSGDRHSITVEPGSGFIWETWEMILTPTNWAASNGAKFDLSTDTLRTTNYDVTSGDAAGLPMFPALVRYDEAERGMVEHALRVTVKRSRYQTFIYPATHFAAPSGNTSTNLPCMGQRLRLKAVFPIPSGWTKEEKAVALAFKKYGALVADNGSIFGISVAPDDRWPGGGSCFDDLLNVGITNFEVIQSTGTNEGPRSAGALFTSAGPDRSVPFEQAVPLQGLVTFATPAPVIQWQLYDGPGGVTFGNAALTNTTAIFSVPGVYRLELSANDGVHAVAYDVVTMTVTNNLNLAITRTGANVNLNWTGGLAPYIVEQAIALPASSWSDILTTSQKSATIPVTNAVLFYRVKEE
jgi:hypothetical protein